MCNMSKQCEKPDTIQRSVSHACVCLTVVRCVLIEQTGNRQQHKNADPDSDCERMSESVKVQKTGRERERGENKPI